MPSRSLRRKLFLTVSLLVIGSGIIISMMVTHRYSVSLYQGAVAQAENIAHSLALDAADKILINDLVALQKLIDDQRRSNPSISYIFIVRDKRILIHTFPKGIPGRLISANAPIDNLHGRLEKIVSDQGDRFLDVAWPIFSGKAGVLRLGFSEKPYRTQVARLRLQMAGFTILILLLSLYVCHLFIKRITQPLSNLSKAVENVDEDNLELDIHIKGYDEVGMLTASFHKMLNRIKEYTQRLQEYSEQMKEKNAELDMLILNSNTESLAIFTERENHTIDDPSAYGTGERLLRDIDRVGFVETIQIDSTVIPQTFRSAEKMALFPIRHEHQLLGGVMVACSDACQCATRELDVIHLIIDQSSGAVRRALSQSEEIRQLRSRLELSAEFSGLIGRDPQMQVIYKLIEDIAATDATILIQGDSGTGKEMVARAIHERSLRKDKPFVVINCSAYPATLLESELFGHEKGAFTGATRQKAGRFELADHGTVFLDEIGEIAPSAQIKLLRVLQNKKFERIGAEKSLTVDVRILAATNKNLSEEVKKGNFREDLFYRLNVIPVLLPPLAGRRNDIPLLARHFLRQFAAEQSKNNLSGFSSNAMRRLLDYSWPGNVRELENSIEHATVLAKGDQTIELSDLPSALLTYESAPAGKILADSRKVFLQNEKQLLLETLESCNWNKKKTALRLGIGRSTLYLKMKKYQIETKPTIH